MEAGGGKSGEIGRWVLYPARLGMSIHMKKEGRGTGMTETMKERHPSWFHATDYHWLKHVRKLEPVDAESWNASDDRHRRDMRSWDGGDPDSCSTCGYSVCVFP